MDLVERNVVPGAHTDDPDAHGTSLALELNNIVNIIGANTGPWPLRHITPNAQSFPLFADHTHQQQPQLHYPSAQSFPGWRSAGLPSDPGTNGVDSGYGETWHGFGWDETSSFQGAECSVDTLQAGELLSGLEIDPTETIPISTISAHGDTEPPFFCKGCNTVLRKKSELNKHAQRHNKPHLCDYKGCPKGRQGEGFSTTNDLIRHKKSVHGEHDKGPVYSCPYGPCADKPDKIWPRADNFRSHLHRSHQRQVTADSDLSIYVKKNVSRRANGGVPQSSSSPKVQQMQPEQPVLENSSGESDTETARVNGEHLVRPDISLTPVAEYSPQGSSDMLLDTSRAADSNPSLAPPIPLTKPSTGTLQRRQQVHNGSFSHNAQLSAQSKNILSPLPRATFAIKEQPTAIRNTEPKLSGFHARTQLPGTTSQKNVHLGIQIASSSGSDDATRQATTFDDVVDSGMEHGQIVAFLKTFPKNFLQKALENDTDMSDRESSISAFLPQRNDNQCTQCEKVFTRPSELKKHQKRHDRPYRCTFRGCSKRFGSKNDWKRHEKKQHQPIDAWVCSILGCHGIFSTAASLHRHAQHEHGASPLGNFQTFLDDCHIGKSENSRFWCGYCSDVIGLDMGAASNHNLDLWVARCDHIDGHLSGKNGLELKQFNQWVYLEDKICVNQYLDMPWDQCEESKMSRKRKGKSPSGDRPAKRHEDGQTPDVKHAT